MFNVMVKFRTAVFNGNISQMADFLITSDQVSKYVGLTFKCEIQSNYLVLKW